MTNFASACARSTIRLTGCKRGCFTRDAGLIQMAFEEIEVGGVIVGDVPSFRVDQMPYGGMKDSGLGREGLRYSIEDMTERKLLVMALKIALPALVALALWESPFALAACGASSTGNLKLLVTAGFPALPRLAMSVGSLASDQLDAPPERSPYFSNTTTCNTG